LLENTAYTLGCLQYLFITDRAVAQRLAEEFRFVESLLREPGQTEVPDFETEYMLGRLAILLPVLDSAIAELDNVKQISV
jgi:hypothetical protein